MTLKLYLKKIKITNQVISFSIKKLFDMINNLFIKNWLNVKKIKIRENITTNWEIKTFTFFIYYSQIINWKKNYPYLIDWPSSILYHINDTLFYYICLPLFLSLPNIHGDANAKFWTVESVTALVCMSVSHLQSLNTLHYLFMTLSLLLSLSLSHYHRKK